MANHGIAPDTSRARDPQITVQGVLKVGHNSREMVVLDIPLGLFTLTVIVPIPDEGSFSVPCYVKFRIGVSGG